MCWTVKQCKEGFSRIIRNGKGTRILQDRWVQGNPITLKRGISLENPGFRKVENLMNIGPKSLNTSLVWNLFSKDRILSTHILKGEVQDYYVWNKTTSGEIITKDAYSLLVEARHIQGSSSLERKFWGKLWVIEMRPKWKIFLRRVIN